MCASSTYAIKNPELRKEDETEPDHLLFLKAYAVCEGYLLRVEGDAEMIGNSIRRMIDVMRKEWYAPDQESKVNRTLRVIALTPVSAAISRCSNHVRDISYQPYPSYRGT